MIFASVPTVVPLSRPIRDGDRVISELTLRAPSIGAIRTLQASRPRSEVERALCLISALSGVPTTSLEALAADDYVALAGAAARMIVVPPAAPRRGLSSIWRR